MNLAKLQDIKSAYRSHYIKALNNPKKDIKKETPFLVNIKNKRLCRAVLCLVAQSYQTLCDPMDYSLAGSSVHRDTPGKNAGDTLYCLSRTQTPHLSPNI